MFSTFVQTKVAKAYRGGASEVTSSNNRMGDIEDLNLNPPVSVLTKFEESYSRP